MTDQPSSISGAVTGSFTYDGNLKRVKQVMDGETIYSVYDASGAMVYRDNQSTGKKTAYFSAGGVGIRAEQGGAVTWTHNDHLGSPVAETNSTGAVNWREQYSPFGEKLINPAANKDKTGFTGHIDDDATGLTYMQARYYDPVIGRFLSIDPVGFTPDAPFMFNRYAYVGNDPVNAVDPDGKFFDIILDAAFIVADVAILVADEVTTGGENRAENLAALGADAAGALIPGATGLGIATRLGTKGASKVAKAAKSADSTSDTTQSFVKKSRREKNADKNNKQKSKTQRGNNNQTGDDPNADQAKQEKASGKRQSRQSKDKPKEPS